MTSPAAAPVGLRIEARGIGRRAGSVQLLSGISFSVNPGEVVALLGPSGAGKSTLLRCLNGYTRPDAGAVRYDGADLYAHRARLARSIGFVPQDDVVHLSLDVETTLSYAMKLRRPEASEQEVTARVGQVLDLVGLTERRALKIARLSGGQRKRVCIGVELVADPAVLFLDEPTSGLDPALEEKMMALFRTLSRLGRTVLLTTHVMESIAMVDHLALLYSGRLVYFGPPAQAAGYFDVKDLPAVYSKLSAESPETWQNRFDASSFSAAAINRSPAAADAPAAPAGPPRDPAEALLDKFKEELGVR